MGIALTLFYDSNDAEKQTLHRRITLSEDQFEEQQERWNNLAEHLIADLGERSSCAMRTWLQGSYKFGTQVRPTRKGDEFDIDLGVCFQWEGAAEDGDHEPDGLKKMVHASLEDYAVDGIIEVVSPRKPRCSRIRFDGDFHIDVPAYHLDPDRDARMLATEENGWEDSDPKAQYLWFVTKFNDQTRAKVRRQIRYLKTWAGLKFPNGADRPSSTLLTVLAAEAIDVLSQDDLACDDDTLACVLEEIVDRLERDRAVPNPAADDYEDLAERLSDDAFDTFLEKLREFHDTANEALECTNMVSAADKWSGAFQHFFPMPEKEYLKDASAGTGRLPVRVITPEVHVQAIARNNRNRQWQSTNTIGPIPKDCDIKFRITNLEAMPDNSVIQWMVRNEGDEAEDINDLGHRAGFGPTASEHSMYKGTHYMDCMVRQHGVIVGMRRIPVTIHGVSMPRRNPAKRPAWIQLRGRK